jgi:hypothetical protein
MLLPGASAVLVARHVCAVGASLKWQQENRYEEVISTPHTCKAKPLIAGTRQPPRCMMAGVVPSCTLLQAATPIMQGNSG